ncbi:UDP-glucose 4-epimerase GalE [Actinorhabdospora filicis]|uniref:UDP-glucose 4-epimerase n=1 Tax=Actinorhabdospora filicis TaxID=1785913 RepID=A0A9W6W695_9ACTN|nr:UDP-glucose 4-epimerase GalE [Actinorhabdospora filicis]GLZ81292.1 UDP-glucose 4-epimerase GalE [Actinorhabdospora filicis]
MTWLVTGGAGYIGAHAVKRLHAKGTNVVVFDDLSTGLVSRVPEGVPLVVGDVKDQAAVVAAIKEHGVTGVLHFAARKSVPESMKIPVEYYRDNVGGLVSIVGAIAETGVERVVFSSTAALYGLAPEEFLVEDLVVDPISVYGETKLIGERLLRFTSKTHGFSWIALRYFNVVGADSPELRDTSVGNLIPIVFRAIDRGETVQVTGGDFPTPDGSGIRDYIHIADLADAHVVAVDHLDAVAAGSVGEVYNVGTGKGSSVLEVLGAVREVTGLPVPHEVVDRRPGDPARGVAGVDKIRRDLGWTARHDLREMVADAWAAWRA